MGELMRRSSSEEASGDEHTNTIFDELSRLKKKAIQLQSSKETTCTGNNKETASMGNKETSREVNVVPGSKGIPVAIVGIDSEGANSISGNFNKGDSGIKGDNVNRSNASINRSSLNYDQNQ